MTDLDLDVGEAAPVRRRRIFPAAVAVTALIGLVVGGVVASATRPAPVVAASSVLTATSRLQGILLDPRPVAVVDVTVTVTGREPVTVTSVTARAADGARSDAGVSERVLEPGRSDTVPLRVPLACSEDDPSQTPPVVTVGLRTPGSATGEVVADPTGRLSRTGGLCTAADAALPGGWSTRLQGTVVARMPAALTVEVAQVPLGQVVVPPRDRVDLQPRSADVTLGPRVRIRLTPPEISDCDRVAGPLPTTLSLRVYPEGQQEPVPVLVQVGPVLAEWLLAPYRAACPNGPNDSPDPISPAVTAP